jgi:hypothetical protein
MLTLIIIASIAGMIFGPAGFFGVIGIWAATALLATIKMFKG